MKSYIHAVRSPVRRPGADRYLLITLLSFALCVTLTRSFLYLTGYPQVGGGGLHIAHVLWGGLLLFIASLLPLIFANRWVYQLVAVLSGAGVGLFIDEVGKFITQTNDYFYQPAAPIIYAFFLMCVFVFLRVNQPPPRGTRQELYAALEAIEEVLDQDLDAGERKALEERLRFVAEQKDHPALAHLAQEMLEFLTSDWISIAPTPHDRLREWQERFFETEAHYLNRPRTRAVLMVGLGVLGLASIVNFFRLILPDVAPAPFRSSPILLSAGGLIPSQSFVYWYSFLGVFHGITGLLLLAGVAMLVIRRENLALHVSYYVLLVHLTILDLLMFYYFQFDTILFAILQFGLVLVLSYYRQHFIKNAPSNLMV